MSICLVIAGKKKLSGGAGVVSDRLSRNLPCNFMIVPEGFRPKLKNILVTTDFSEHSTLALQQAIDMKNQDGNIELSAHHSYKVPMGYSKSGKSYEEFADIMKLNSGKEMSNWIKSFHKNIIEVLTFRDHDSLFNQTMQVVEENEIDLLIIGSKGQSSASFVLLGSHAVKMLKANERIPTLVVKKKGENLDVIDALSRI